MINVYGLCYRILEYADKTVDSLRKNASENFNLICIESKSCNSNKFLEWGKNSLKENKINKFITSSTNCRGDGLRWAIENIPPDTSEDFIIITDLDLILPPNTDWIKETRIKMKKNVICGFTLSNENYTPPNWGWYEEKLIEKKLFGNWLMGLKIIPFFETLKELKNEKKQIEDHIIINKMCKYGTKDIIDKKLYHLGWDSWKDDPEYWKDKQKNFPQSWQTNKDEYDTDEIPKYAIYE